MKDEKLLTSQLEGDFNSHQSFAEIPFSRGVGILSALYRGLLVSLTPQECICTHWAAPGSTLASERGYFIREGITRLNRIPKASKAKTCSLVKAWGYKTARMPKTTKPRVTSLERRLGITRVVMTAKAIKATTVSIFAIFSKDECTVYTLCC